MVQVHRVKKKSLNIMNVMFWLMSTVFEIQMKNITVLIEKHFFPCKNLHMLLTSCKYTQMYLAKATSKDQFKSTFLVFDKTTFVTFLHAMLIFIQSTHISHAIITSPLLMWKRCNLWLTRSNLLFSMKWMWAHITTLDLLSKIIKWGKTSRIHQSWLHYNYYHHTRWLDKQIQPTCFNNHM